MQNKYTSNTTNERNHKETLQKVIYLFKWKKIYGPRGVVRIKHEEKAGKIITFPAFFH